MQSSNCFYVLLFDSQRDYKSNGPSVRRGKKRSFWAEFVVKFFTLEQHQLRVAGACRAENALAQEKLRIPFQGGAHSLGVWGWWNAGVGMGLVEGWAIGRNGLETWFGTGLGV